MTGSGSPIELADAKKQKLATHIGWVVLHAASMEHAATTLHMALLDSEVGSVVSTGQSWQVLRRGLDALIAARRALIDPTSPETEELVVRFDDMTRLVARADKLIDDRNTAVHSLWFVASPDQPAEASTLRPRTFRQADARQWQLADVEKLAQDLARTAGQFTHLYLSYRLLHPRQSTPTHKE